MPIGNLTSQLFANVYLHEFDRYVRHTLKPLGYVRYGDDFVIFMPGNEQALAAQTLGTIWLQQELYLTVHASNDVICRAVHGLHFLGHRVYPGSISVNPALVRKINQQIAAINIASYQAQMLPRDFRNQLLWLLAGRGTTAASEDNQLY